MSYPTHQVKGVFVQNGQRIQTQKIKFIGGDDPEKAGRATIETYLTQGRRNKPFEIEKVEVTKLKAPKLGAKLNKQHDYVTLTATFLDGTARITSSWGGFKVSGDFIRHPATDKLFAASFAYEKRTKKNVAGALEQLLPLANSSKEFTEFVKKTQKTLETLA